MKKLLFLTLFVSLSGLTIESELLIKTPESSLPWIVRVYYDDKSQVQQLSEVTDLWEVNTTQKFAVAQIDSTQELDLIQQLGLQLRIDNRLQDKYVLKNKLPNTKHGVKGTNVIDGFSCYSTVEGTYSRMEEMASGFPNLTEIIDIGDSWEKTVNNTNGYDLKVLKITNKSILGEKPIVFITTAIHAREYATAELTTRFAEFLLSQYEINSDIKWMLDHQEVQLLLHTNPDGRKKAETGILWRKNTNQSYCSPNSDSRGADLNRNYPFLWEANNNQCSDVFSGSSAQSEPEINSVINHLVNIYEDNRGELITDVVADDTAGVFLDIHSFSQLVLWPWGFTSNAPPNVEQLAAFGRRVAFYNGYTPEPVSDLTIAKGGSIDTSYGDLGVASLAFELGTEFFQDCDVFENKILPDNLEALIYVTRVARRPYISPLGPDIENLKIIPNYIFSNQPVKISGVANEDRYNHSHGVQSFDEVQSIDMYIDDLPWLGVNSQSINPSDKSFDSSSEAFSQEISATSLTIGQHTIFTAATDNTGKTGAVYSRFLNVVEAESVGTLSGKVTDARTGEIISAAELSINNSRSLSNTLGDYSILAPPIAMADLQISSVGYVSKVINDITITQQNNIQQNIQLEPFCSVFSDNIETGLNGWQATSLWAINDQQSSSPTHSWTDSPNGNYANNINTSLSSPIINIAGSDSLEISFMHLCDTEAGFDFGHVEVKFDNDTWQEIFRCDGDSTWQDHTSSVGVPVNAQQLQLRFRLTSDGFVTRDGWYIDDVNLKVSGEVCSTFFNDIIFVNGFE